MVMSMQTCPVCGGINVTELWTTHDRMYHLSGEFKTARCQECASLFLVNPPENLGIYYPEEEYYSFSNPTNRSSNLTEVRNCGIKKFVKDVYSRSYLMQEIIDLVLPRYSKIDLILARTISSTPRRILDVGCGSGQALDFYRKFGWETWGVEPGKQGAARAAAAGHRVLEGDFCKVELPGAFFDLVRFRHSLEHLHDPVSALEKARFALKNGGLCLIELPNIAGWLAMLTKQYYWQIDAPRHLVIPHLRALLSLLSAKRLTVIKTSTYSYGSGVANSFFFWRFGKQHSEPAHGWRLASSRKPGGYRLIEKAVDPFAILADIIRKGDNVRLVARKEER